MHMVVDTSLLPVKSDLTLPKIRPTDNENRTNPKKVSLSSISYVNKVFLYSLVFNDNFVLNMPIAYMIKQGKCRSHSEIALMLLWQRCLLV